jgi:hypothetical protein
MTQTKEKIQRDWNKIVADPKNGLQFVPESLLPAVKAWNDKRKELNEYIKQAAKLENETTNLLYNAVFDIRKYFEKNGVDDIWTKDIGFQTEALKEGIFILEVRENLPQNKQ